MGLHEKRIKGQSLEIPAPRMASLSHRHRNRDSKNRVKHSKLYLVLSLGMDINKLHTIYVHTHSTHRLFQNFSAKEFQYANEGPILHRESISFHLSHVPPLKVMCHFLCSKSDKFTTQKVTRNFQR